MPNRSTIRPRRIALDVSRTNPVAPPVRWPSTITRTRALLPLVAATELGEDVIWVGRGGVGYWYGVPTWAWVKPSMSTVFVTTGRALRGVIVQSWVTGSKLGSEEGMSNPILLATGLA